MNMEECVEKRTIKKAYRNALIEKYKIWNEKFTG